MTNSRWHRLLVLLVFATAITACAPSADRPGSTVGPFVPDGQVGGPPDTGGGTGDNSPDSEPDFALLHRAEELLVQSCMANAGFEYFPVPYTDQNPMVLIRFGESSELYTLSESEAASTGFQSFSMPGAENEEIANDPNVRYVEALAPADHARYEHALLGGSEDWIQVQVTPDGGALEIGTGGCRGGSRSRLYGDLADYVRLTFLTGNISWEAWQRFSAGSDFLDAHAAWLGCLEDGGYSVNSIADLLGSVTTTNERELAGLHAVCLTQSGLRAAVVEGHKAEVARVRSEREGELIAATDMQQRAVDEAKAVLQDPNDNS